MSNNKQTTGYICPKTTKQCDDECCVSADECHIEAWEKVVTTEEMTWDEYGNYIQGILKPSINGGDNMNNNPGNTDNTMNMTVLRNHITMYLDDIESYGTRKDLADATDVLFDFVKYIDAMGVLDGEQAMIDYNAMEEEWEMDNYNEMQQ
jgi:hypothetical protein